METSNNYRNTIERFQRERISFDPVQVEADLFTLNMSGRKKREIDYCGFIDKAIVRLYRMNLDLVFLYSIKVHERPGNQISLDDLLYVLKSALFDFIYSRNYIGLTVNEFRRTIELVIIKQIDNICYPEENLSTVDIWSLKTYIRDLVYEMSSEYRAWLWLKEKEEGVIVPQGKEYYPSHRIFWFKGVEEYTDAETRQILSMRCDINIEAIAIWFRNRILRLASFEDERASIYINLKRNISDRELRYLSDKYLASISEAKVCPISGELHLHIGFGSITIEVGDVYRYISYVEIVATCDLQNVLQSCIDGLDLFEICDEFGYEPKEVVLYLRIVEVIIENREKIRGVRI